MGADTETRILHLDDYRSRVAGSWIAKNVGVLLGQPFDGRPKPPKPVTGYVKWNDPGDPAAGVVPYKPAAAPCDDNTYCDVVALRAFERYGLWLTPQQLGKMWLAEGAGFQGASLAARQAMLAGHWPPECGRPPHNPHYSDSDAQVSSTLYGLIAPGEINLAASTARTFNHINGFAEGSDGGVLFAAMISEAVFEPSLRSLVLRALNVLDSAAPTRVACEEIVAFRDSSVPWTEAAWRSQERWRSRYPQANNAVANAALVVLGLLYGEGDFMETMNIILRAADRTNTAGNAGIAASILGLMSGLRIVPAALVQPLADTYPVAPRANPGDAPLAPRQEKLSELALRMAVLGSKFIIKRGRARRDGHILTIPNPEPAAQPLETAAPWEGTAP
ncbi:MAG: ADP-ribosylglycohydrolase family protein [Verrucomicrobiae bacterium]|nr:ADP-ribosylglycohydrolase family protein [Verrucomicrobiae bacterium]